RTIQLAHAILRGSIELDVSLVPYPCADNLDTLHLVIPSTRSEGRRDWRRLTRGFIWTLGENVGGKSGGYDWPAPRSCAALANQQPPDFLPTFSPTVQISAPALR
ncbi:hypothetical protein IscW_ISCW005157, partial [Ixodes scapularis]